MKDLGLVYYGNPLLRKKCAKVEGVKKIQKYIEPMFELMYDEMGLGLAAIQVGILERFFIIDMSQSYDDDKNLIPGKKEIFINPKIYNIRGSYEEEEEGCLSVPEIRAKVRRRSIIDIEYTNLEGQKVVEEEVKGLRARAMQHETDHLNGVLFVDKVSPAKKLLLKNELKRIAEEYF